MIDPNKVNFQTNPLYTSKQEKAEQTGKSQGVDVKQVQPDTVKTETTKKTNSFVQFFKDIGATIKSAFASKTPAADTAKIVHLDPLAKAVSVEKKDFNASALSKEELLPASYTMLKKNCDKITNPNDKLTNFERLDSIASAIRSGVGKSDEVNALASKCVKSLGKEPLAVRKQKFDEALEKSGNAEKLVEKTTARIDDFMVSLFGEPGDPDSTKKAAARLPKDMANLLALQFRAIEDSTAPANLKPEMKKNIARDTLALRCLNPAIMSIATDPKTDPKMKASILELAKAVQSLCNGTGLGTGKDLAPQLQGKSDEMKNRWTDHMQEFAQAVLDRADPVEVNTYVAVGKGLAPLVKEPVPKTPAQIVQQN